MELLKERVQEAIEKLRPSLQRDGGDLELVDVKDNVVMVKLTGACVGCPMAHITLKDGVERFIKQMVPEVSRVESVN